MLFPKKKKQISNILRFLIFSLILSALIPLTETLSYIPKLSTILSRTAENNGLGIYLIIQEVRIKKTQNKNTNSSPTFHSNDKPHSLFIREKWLIKNENTMRLSFEGKDQLNQKITGTYIYDSKSRHFKTHSGEVKSSPKGDFWFESFFHFRNPDKMLEEIKKRKILSALDLLEISNQTRKKNTSTLEEKKTTPFYEKIRLMRVGGVITYGIGNPSYAKTLFPGLWIEQDHFLIKKIRLLNDRNIPLEIKAKNHKSYPKNLWFPTLRKVTWNQKEAFLQVLSVQSVRPLKKTLQSLSPKSLIDKRYINEPYQWGLGEENQKETLEIKRSEETEKIELNQEQEKKQKEAQRFKEDWMKEFYHQFR